MRLFVFVAILVLCIVALIVNSYIRERSFMVRLSKVMLIMFFVHVLIALLCYEILPSQYMYIDRAGPFAFIYGPFIYFSILSMKNATVPARTLIYHSIAFGVAVLIFLAFILSSGLRSYWGFNFYIYWYSAMLLSWSIYFIVAFVSFFKQGAAREVNVFTTNVLVVFFAAVSFMIIILLDTDFKAIFESSESSSLFIFFCMLLIVLFIYLNQLDRFRQKDIVQISDDDYFESKILNYIQVSRHMQPKEDLSLNSVHNGTLENSLLSKIDFLNPDLDLQTQARLLGMSVPELSKNIKELTGNTYLNYVNNRRIQYFVDNIEAVTPADIEAQAFKCGFKSKASFYRNFKKYTGLSPVDYLKKHQNH